MTVKYYVRKLIRLFPEFQRSYQMHRKYYHRKFLPHVFFGDALNPILSELLKTNQDTEQIEKYIAFLEDMYQNGDTDVRNIVEVTILEYLGDDETVLRHAFGYFSEDLMQASKAVEASWGRRDIRIFYRGGKVFADW